MGGTELQPFLDRLRHDDLAALTGSSRVEFTVVGRCEGGTSGAWRVRHRDGRELIMKVVNAGAASWYRRVCDRVERLRASGYPAPAHALCVLDDAVVVAQSALDGERDPRISAAIAADILQLDLQVGLGRDDPDASRAGGDFAAMVRRSLVTGLDGYCEHASLEAHSNRTRAIVGRAREIGAALDVDDLGTDDLIHGDFHTANILARDDTRISGVVDWESVTVGDCLFDLARMAL